jgi:8-oxo-dGTP diphosphatase
MSNIIVCSNLIEKHGQFLVVRETKEVAKDNYNFPSGTLEPNEEIIVAAKREAQEETGLVVEPETLLGIFQIPKSQMGNNILIYVFHSKIIEGSITSSKDHPEVKFVSLEDLKTFGENNQLRHHGYMLHAIDAFLNKKFIDISILKTISPDQK